MFELDGSVLPVQISADIILVLSKTSVIVGEAETCSNLEKKQTNTPHQRLVRKYPLA